MSLEAVRREAARQVEAGCAAGDEVEKGRADDRANDLRGDVGGDLIGREPAACGKADRYGGVQMAARNMADRVGHRDHGEAKGERHAE